MKCNKSCDMRVGVVRNKSTNSSCDQLCVDCSHRLHPHKQTHTNVVVVVVVVDDRYIIVLIKSYKLYILGKREAIDMSNQQWVPPTTAIPVQPKEDCPHVNEKNVDQTLGALSQILQQYQNNKCSICNDPNENWICLSCLKIFCSRLSKKICYNYYYYC
jgi:hypothetical protein